MSVDAIMGTVEAHSSLIARCHDTLKDQVDHTYIVLDGWLTQPWKERSDVTCLHRSQRHGPAASFNHGAEHSEAGWLLYVDPHNRYKQGSVKQMLSCAGDEYDFVLGCGDTVWLKAGDPWATALARCERGKDVPLTFLIKKTLFDELGGIPEPPHCHMETLADTLLQNGVAVARLGGMVTHDAQLSFRDYLYKYYMSGYSYAALAEAGYPIGESADIVRIARGLDTEQITQLLGMAFTALNQLGALDGLGATPAETLPVDDFLCQWLRPPEKEDVSDD